MTDDVGEDRAPSRRDLSVDPGAKAEGWRHNAALSFPFGIGTKAINRPVPTNVHYLISRPPKLHFTLNHYTEGHHRIPPAVTMAGQMRKDERDI